MYIITRPESNNKISNGDKVNIIYEAKTSDDRVFNSSNGEIITLTIGENTLPWVDNALIWANSWDFISINIPASEWYVKYYDPNKVQKLPIYTLLESGITPEENNTIILWTQITTIRWVDWDIVTLDSNPLHTWQDLMYTIQILWVEK